MLKLGAIDLDACAGLAKKRLSQRFHYARLAGAGGPEEEQIADRTAGRVQPRQKHLVDLGDFFDRGVLSHDLAAQCRFEFGCVVAAKGGIECGIKTGFHKYCIPLKVNHGAQYQSVQMGESSFEL